MFNLLRIFNKDNSNKNIQEDEKSRRQSYLDELQEKIYVKSEFRSAMNLFISDEDNKVKAYLSVVNGESKKAPIKSQIKQIKTQAENNNVELFVINKSLEDVNDLNNNVKSKDIVVADTRMQTLARNTFAMAEKSKASDIHINVETDIARVKIRVHGLLKEVDQWDKNTAEQFISTVYNTMCDVSDTHFDRQTPQSARIKDKKYLPSTVFGIRMATTPQSEGMYAVFRLLSKQSGNEITRIKDLGYEDSQVSLIEKMKKKPVGLNIIVGATGSGKSTTIQSILTEIGEVTKGQKNIISVEDPPEYPIKGVTQIPVANARDESERKAKFNQAITAAMRLDPDIIMLGEIRDEASAKLGLRAAMTGHPVWTTLHANSVFGAIDRLMDYDVSLDMLSDPMIMSGIVYQTLVPTLCPHCKIPLKEVNVKKESDLESSINRLLKIANQEGYDNDHLIKNVFIRGNGCDHCKNGPFGVIGRTVVAEVLYPDNKILELLRHNEREAARKHWVSVMKEKPVSYNAGRLCLRGNVDPLMAEDRAGFFDHILDVEE